MSREPGQSKVFTRQATGLIRDLTTRDTFAMSIGGMVGILWLVGVPSEWSLFPGLNIPLSLIIAVLLGFVSAMYYMLIAAIMPRTGGGSYVPLSRMIHPILGLGMTFIMATAFILNIGFLVPLTISFITSPLSVYATVTGNTFLSNSLPWYSTPVASLLIGSLVIAFIAVIMIFGSRVIRPFNVIVVSLELLGVVALFAVLLSITPSAFQTKLGSFAGSGVYQNITSTAAAQGYSTPSNWLTPTIISLPFSFFLFTGWASASYFSGEIRRVNRTLPLAITTAMITVAVMYGLLTVLMQNAFGDQFIRSAVYLFNSAPGHYPLSVPPWATSFVPLITSNLAVNVFLIVSYFATDLLIMYMFFYMVSRHVLAWSFDRAVPSSMSTVNERFHSPVRAIVLTAVLAWLSIIFYVYLPVVSGAVNLSYLFIIFLLFDGLAGFMFIWKNKGLVSASLGVAGRKIGRVPVVSILGLCDFILLLSMLIISLYNPLIAGPLGTVTLETVFAAFLLAVVSYFAMKAYLGRKGIDLSLAFKEIPPE